MDRRTKTVCIDPEGEHLATFNDELKLVSMGSDFYVGQKRYTVTGISYNEYHDELLITLQEPQEKER